MKHVTELNRHINKEHLDASTASPLDHADILIGQGDYLSALDIYKELIEQSPQHYNIYYKAGLCLYVLNKYDLTLNYALIHSHHMPDHVDGNILLGNIYLALKNFKKV